MDKATNFKFCTHIHRIDLNKSPVKISAKSSRGRTQAFQSYCRFCAPARHFSNPTSSLPLNISLCSPGNRQAFRLRRANVLGSLSVQLVSKISNVCGPDPPTLQTDRQTDDMQFQYRALHYSASRGNNFNSARKYSMHNSDDRLPCTTVHRPKAQLSKLQVKKATENARSYMPIQYTNLQEIHKYLFNRSTVRLCASAWAWKHLVIGSHSYSALHQVRFLRR